MYDYEDFYRVHMREVLNNVITPLDLDSVNKEFQMYVVGLSLFNLLLLIVFYLTCRNICCNDDPDDDVIKVRNNNLEFDRWQIEEYQAQSDAWARSIENAQEERKFKRARTRNRNKVKTVRTR